MASQSAETTPVLQGQLPPPPLTVMPPKSITGITFNVAYTTAVADCSYVKLGEIPGVSAVPLDIVEKGSARRSIQEDYRAWEDSKVSGNLDKTEVKETPSSPGGSPSAQTAYSINPKSLNVPSVRDASKEESIGDMAKFEVSDDPQDGKTMPSHLRESPGISMFFEMIDSSYTRQGIRVPNLPGFEVTTLKLTPNPDSLTINSTKKVNRYTTLSGWVEEHWGDEIDTINFNGSTFSFYDNSSEYHRGLTNEFRDETGSYKYLKELIHYFQVNGCIYQGNSYDGYFNMPAVNDFLNNNPEFRANHPRKGMIKERLYIKMSYDYLTLYGRFDTFDIVEDSKVPFLFKYSAVFKAEKTVYNL